MDPKVGIGVFVQNGADEFILGKRKGSLGAGTWGLPGGHLEYGETFESCAAREVAEETGVRVCNLHFLTAVNSVIPQEGKHYVTIFVGGRVIEEGMKPQILEPNKCSKWEWVSWDQLRGIAETQMRADGPDFEGPRLFEPLLSLLRQRPGFRV